MFELVDNVPESAIIKVVGVGGGGGNAVKHMIANAVEGGIRLFLIVSYMAGISLWTKRRYGDQKTWEDQRDLAGSLRPALAPIAMSTGSLSSVRKKSTRSSGGSCRSAAITAK